MIQLRTVGPDDENLPGSTRERIMHRTFHALAQIPFPLLPDIIFSQPFLPITNGASIHGNHQPCLWMRQAKPGYTAEGVTGKTIVKHRRSVSAQSWDQTGLVLALTRKPGEDNDVRVCWIHCLLRLQL